MYLQMPNKGGVRGGKDQFNWEEVKSDKHRENYLGHSLKAPIGHVHKVKDHHWYNKEKAIGVEAENEHIANELKIIKEMEKRAMNIALGNEDESAISNSIYSNNKSNLSVSLSDKIVQELLRGDLNEKKIAKKIKKDKKKKEKRKNEKRLLKVRALDLNPKNRH